MAKFLTGNITGHINKMTLAWAIWILAIFIVDFVDMYFLSLLGESELAAAVWFAWVLLFMLTSIWIATMITMSSLLSKKIWKWEIISAKKISTSIYYFSLALWIPLTIIFYFSAPFFLELIWAKWVTLDYAISYFKIAVVSFPFMLLWMASNWVLRWIWDAKRSMYPTLVAWAVNIVLDPIFIFVLWMGIEGAALATAISRVSMFIVAFYGVYIHNFLSFHSVSEMKDDMKWILSIFIPAMITNISTPIGSWYVLKEMSKYWDDAVAGMAVIWRLIPIVFVYIFAMSWAIWSIVGQNYGAGNFERTKEAILKSFYLASAYVIWVSFVLLLCNWLVIQMFDLKWDGKELLQFYSTFIAIFFAFNAVIFLGNSVFNVIWKAKYSMVLNIVKSVFLLIPLVFVGSKYFGMKWILIGESISFVITAVLTLYFLYKFVFCRCAKHEN